jgi:hypothetical protein
MSSRRFVLCAGTKRMCLAGIRIKLVISPWPLIAYELHGVSCHTGSIKVPISVVSVHSEDGNNTCR